MSITFRPAVREKTPLIIGVGGPTKSGKTMSALRLALGLAGTSPVIMINAEGPRGHQYADKFKYLACDITPPYRPMQYTEALLEAATLRPGAVIIDSASHMHDGPGGVLAWHEEILDRIAGNDYAKRERSTFVAWVEPKAAENEFIYTMLGMTCPVILCFRAKEKIKISKGKVEELGWQPIAGERVAFETIFTLMLPPHSKGVPDLAISEMREPFDELVPKGKALDEALGRELAKWATGAKPAPAAPAPAPSAPTPAPAPQQSAEEQLFGNADLEREQAAKFTAIMSVRDTLARKPDTATWDILCRHYAKVPAEQLEHADLAALDDFLQTLKKVADNDQLTIQAVNAVVVKARTERKSA